MAAQACSSMKRSPREITCSMELPSSAPALLLKGVVSVRVSHPREIKQSGLTSSEGSNFQYSFNRKRTKQDLDFDPGDKSLPH